MDTKNILEEQSVWPDAWRHKKNSDEAHANDNSNIPSLSCRKMMDLEEESLKAGSP